jgi:hypothetical protein
MRKFQYRSWKKLREQNNDRFSDSIDGIFMEFRNSLKRTVIEDMTTGETIPLQANSRFDTMLADY